MRTPVLLLLAGLSGLATARAQDLPAGPGAAATGRVCGQCHGLEVFSTSRKSGDEWDKTIGKMVEKGLQITDDDYQTVLDYLTKSLGIKVNVNKASAKELVAFGLTPKEAESIVAYRAARGNFKDVGEIEKVEGVDAKKIEAKKDSIEFRSGGAESETWRCIRVSIAGSDPTAIEAGFTFDWEFMQRTFSTCRVETFSTPVLREWRVPAECPRGEVRAATLPLRRLSVATHPAGLSR
jgi:competence ComEA-like helix-hairpin-helix protein